MSTADCESAGCSRVAKRLQEVIGFVAFGGDLLTEFVASPEFFANDCDDVVGVQVGLGKDQGLGDLPPARGRCR